MKTPEPKGIDKSKDRTFGDLTNKAKNYKMENVMSELPDNYGVENFAKLIEFGGKTFEGIHEALADDDKISLMEGLMLGVSLGPSAFGLISAVPQIPQEIVFDTVSEDDLSVISKKLDEIPTLKGDTRDASREFLTIIFLLKDWYFKYFVEPQAPQV